MTKAQGKNNQGSRPAEPPAGRVQHAFEITLQPDAVRGGDPVLVVVGPDLTAALAINEIAADQIQSAVRLERPKRMVDFVLPEPERRLLQVRIDSDLLTKAERRRVQDGLTWQVLVEACFRRYLLEQPQPIESEPAEPANDESEVAE